MRVKIYSNEHTAWWKENYFGYTNNESEAGIFEIEEVNKKYPYIDFDTTKEDYLVKFEGLTYEELEKENQELKEDKKALIKNANCCDWHDCIEITKENEKLKKENQELKELVESLHKEQIIQAERIFDLEIENTKLKEVIKFLGEQLGLEPDLENHNLITDDGTIGFVNADEETMSILKLLREVIENE